jgi:wyosine [tRNA(Phe)-imidazoG37] synthetase (radical SAM superfamily)
MTELRDNCPTVYGPVFSRRHGKSLGINLGKPLEKVCTWGCLYCQCGVGERRRFTPSDQLPSNEEVLKALRAKLDECGSIDSLTFAGNSEPGAHPQFLAIVQEVRGLREERAKKWILNCLSNGSELDRDEVVQACDLLDEAWIKLDCATDDLSRRLNRPIAQAGTVLDQVTRIKRLQVPRIQTLVWSCSKDPRLQNWNEENLNSLMDVYNVIRPFEIHVATVSRKPAWVGIEPVPVEELKTFVKRLQNAGLNAKAFG